MYQLWMGYIEGQWKLLILNGRKAEWAFIGGTEADQISSMKAMAQAMNGGRNQLGQNLLEYVDVMKDLPKDIENMTPEEVEAWSDSWVSEVFGSSSALDIGGGAQAASFEVELAGESLLDVLEDLATFAIEALAAL